VASAKLFSELTSFFLAGKWMCEKPNYCVK